MSLALLGNYHQGVLQLHPDLTVGRFNRQKLGDITVSDGCMVIDGSALVHCDSVGVAALIWLTEQTAGQGIEVSWQSLPATLTDLLDLYELDFMKMAQLCRKN